MKHTTLFTIAILGTLSSTGVFALVTAPSSASGGNSTLELLTTFERGKVEPNENPASYSAARIDMFELSYQKRLDQPLAIGVDNTLGITYGTFEAAEERVGGTLYHPKTRGHVLTLQHSLNFVHTAEYSFGGFLSVSPLASFDQGKFSVPRVDLARLGFFGAMELSPAWFFESGVLYGLGVPGRQNSYLALNETLGSRLGSWIGAEWIARGGLYVEVDTRERTDARYDAGFSVPGRTDRIRASKFGYLLGVDSGWGEGWSVGAKFVQKLGGYDAPATQAYQFKLGRSF